MPATPVLIHLAFALVSLLLGPFALWLRKGTPGHRAAGYAWVLAMIGAATSSLFIRDFALPNLAGYTPIHLLTAAAFVGIGLGMVHILRGRVQRHRTAMRYTYVSVLIAGGFALLPQRFLGEMLWHQALGWI